MQPRAEEIHRVLSAFVDAPRPRSGEASQRRWFMLVVQGSGPLRAELREIRAACAMVDVGSSIFTLAYEDILGLDPVPGDQGGLRLTVRPGCFASHVAARLRRASRTWGRRGAQEETPLQQTRQPAAVPSFEAFTSVEATDGGITEVDPAEPASARQEVAVKEASRTRSR